MSKHTKVALVTGAAGILGPDICRVLTEDGWTVAASEHTLEDFAITEKYRGEIVAAAKFEADLSKLEECPRLIREVESALGPVSLIVNNAAKGASGADIDSLAAEELEHLYRVNVIAPFLLVQAALPSLTASKGSVIMISSVMTQVIKVGFMPYALTKSALEEQTTYLAHELGPRGVRVNCIRLGSFPGAAFMRDTLKDLPAEDAKALYDYVMPMHTSDEPGQVPLRGKAEDLGEMIAFLASEKASFVHGAVIPLDGGYAFRHQDQQVTGRQERSRQAVRDWLKAHGKEA